MGASTIVRIREVESPAGAPDCYRPGCLRDAEFMLFLGRECLWMLCVDCMEEAYGS